MGPELQYVTQYLYFFRSVVRYVIRSVIRSMIRSRFCQHVPVFEFGQEKFTGLSRNEPQVLTEKGSRENHGAEVGTQHAEMAGKRL